MIGHFWLSLPTTQHHLLQRSVKEERDEDAGVHINSMEVRQAAAVAAIDSHDPREDFFIGKIPDLIRIKSLQLVEEFLAPLLPHFLSIWG
jgi:hypothetical protein